MANVQREQIQEVSDDISLATKACVGLAALEMAGAYIAPEGSTLRNVLGGVALATWLVTVSKVAFDEWHKPTA